MWKIIEYDEVTSTNTLAAERLASGGAEHGDVIQARHQTAGRGRNAGRTWEDEPAASLLMSVILKEVPPPPHLLQYRAALGVLDALRTMSRAAEPEAFRLKWPNDVFYHGKKISGLLLEAQWNGLEMRSAVIGIGVNVRQRSFPEELTAIATSLAIGGVDAEVSEVRDAILGEFGAHLILPATESEVLNRLRTELSWMTSLPPITHISPEGATTTDLRFEGLSDDGGVLLRRSDGSEITAHSGSLVW